MKLHECQLFDYIHCYCILFLWVILLLKHELKNFQNLLNILKNIFEIQTLHLKHPKLLAFPIVFSCNQFPKSSNSKKRTEKITDTKL